jgi:hypothetical protein
MCSRYRSCVILATRAALLPALTSCGGQTLNRAKDDATQVSSRASPPTVVRPNASLPVEQTAPATDSMHFDLDCQLAGHVVSDPHPSETIGPYPANALAWHYRSRLIVDLQALRVCDWGACERYGPYQISATTDRIVLQDVPGASIFISRHNWRYEQRQEDLGRVSVTRGRCIPRRFTGFPASGEGSEPR